MASLTDITPVFPALAGMLVLAGRQLATRRTRPAELVVAANLPFALFVFGLAVVVLALLPAAATGGPPTLRAVLIVVDVGPNLTYVGSLANLLWRRVVATTGEESPSAARFSLVGLATVPLTLVLTTVARWAAHQA